MNSTYIYLGIRAIPPADPENPRFLYMNEQTLVVEAWTEAQHRSEQAARHAKGQEANRVEEEAA